MLIDTSKLSVQFTVQGKTHTIEGFAEDCWATEQLWHKFLGTKDGNYFVDCTDDNWKTWLVTFTKEGYDKHIKDLKPSVKSPFVFNKVDP